jgi:hypothetical protein
MNANDDRELKRLMNDQLDGTATPEESERLSRALEFRDDVRSEYRKLGGVFAALSRIEMEEPPASLKQNVLRAIRVKEASAGARKGWLDRILVPFQGRAGLRYGYSFATGAALGVLAFALLSGYLPAGTGTDSRSLTGTMAPFAGERSYRHISSRDYNLGDGRVTTEGLSGQDDFLVRITADVPLGSELTLSFDPSDWSLSGVRQQTAGNEVMLGTGRISVRMQRLGESQYLLYLARTGPLGSPLRIAIHSPDGYVQGEVEMGSSRSGS